MVIPRDMEGKVLVEFTGACDKGFASFYAYARGGLLPACFTMLPLAVKEEGLYYSGREVWYVTLRSPPENHIC
ncbi:MAG: hypothetical protein KIT10_12160 [Flavobacteriales bacterium]|nr:hypothetical protein [Flavobacteriales bacterium]